jgi:hypothetical protein
MRERSLVVAGTALAALSLALPWRWVPGTLTYLTSGYYTNYCDYSGWCYATYTPGVLIPGLPDGTYPGGDTVLRFYVAAALVLALWWGVHLGARRAFRWAAYVLLAGALMSNIDGLTGGLVAVLAAAACFWMAGRRSVVEEVAPVAGSATSAPHASTR